MGGIFENGGKIKGNDLIMWWVEDWYYEGIVGIDGWAVDSCILDIFMFVPNTANTSLPGNNDQTKGYGDTALTVIITLAIIFCFLMITLLAVSYYSVKKRWKRSSLFPVDDEASAIELKTDHDYQDWDGLFFIFFLIYFTSSK